MMKIEHVIPCFLIALPELLTDIAVGVNLLIEFVYKYVEIPLQNIFYYFGNCLLCYPRRRSWLQYSTYATQLLLQSYVITIFIYFNLLLSSHLFTISIQKHYFIDPILSKHRQCINIKFIRVLKRQYSFRNDRLTNNFVVENCIVNKEKHRQDVYNYTRLHQLLNLLENDYYMICQRSLYVYSRFHAYSSLLHSNHSQYRFLISNYPSSFTIDQPPFLDLCLHTSNRSHLDDLKSRLLPLSTYYYESVNLFLFDFNFTQVTLTLYQLDNHSTLLERISVHTGWLYSIYSKYQFFKYSYALSTVLFDGLSKGQQSVDYFNYTNIPVPADPLLGLNEMVQQTLLVLPLCRSKCNK